MKLILMAVGKDVDLQGEGSVCPGTGGVGGAVLQNGGADQRISGFSVEDGAGQGNGLGDRGAVHQANSPNASSASSGHGE